MKLFPFLLLLMIWGGCKQEPALEIRISNPVDQAREKEMVEIYWQEIQRVFPEITAENIVVLEATDGQEIPSQVVYEGKEEPQKLIFPVSLAGGESITRVIKAGTRADYPAQVYGRLVPERKDDFAWENDKIAFRMYGPALEATGEISNGIDVWVKSTPELIINSWYADGNYHVDHGQGLDCYKVGRTLGAGAMAPLENDSLVLGNNFISSEILDMGPLRITFRLKYAPYFVGEREVVETRTISLDAGSHFNRIEEYYENVHDYDMEVAAGIVLREGEGVVWMNAAERIAAYWEPQNNDNNMDNGHTAVAVIFQGEMKAVKQLQKHIVAITNYTPGEAYLYYAGAAWSKGGIANREEWLKVMSGELLKISYPLEWEVVQK